MAIIHLIDVQQRYKINCRIDKHEIIYSLCLRNIYVAIVIFIFGK